MKVFIAGATGYIGGEVLSQILSQFPSDSITALIRSQEKSDILTDKFPQIKSVIGTLDNLDEIKTQCEEADIIINTASNNHIGSLNVIKDVLSKKQSKTLFIQISGAGVISDSTDPAKYVPEKVYSDVSDIDEINSLDASQPHRPADKLVLSMEQCNPEFIKTVIISPPVIFGISNGFNNKLSVQLPWLIKAVYKVGYNFTVYKGETRWSHVHIEDIGALFTLIIKLFEKGQDFKSGYYGYYFANDGSDQYWKDVAIKVTDELYSRGLISSTEIKELSPEEVSTIFRLPALFWGSNARTVSEAARSIGWVPKKSSDADFWNDIKVSTDYMVEHNLLRETNSH